MQGLAEALDSARREHDAGNLAQAELLYQNLLQREPNQPQGWLRLGEVRLQLGKAAEAVAAFENVLRLEPKKGTGDLDRMSKSPVPLSSLLGCVMANCLF